MSKPTWKTAFNRAALHVGFFVSGIARYRGRMIPMTHRASMAQEIGQAAIVYEETRWGRRPQSVTVVLGGDTLVITLHGVLSRAEMTLAENPAGAAKLQEFHRELFHRSSEPLRNEIKRITGVEVGEIAKETATAVQVFPSGTVVQVYLLHGHVLDADHWTGM
jgi:uncharacterized protein YbcI